MTHHLLYAGDIAPRSRGARAFLAAVAALVEEGRAVRGTICGESPWVRKARGSAGLYRVVGLGPVFGPELASTADVIVWPSAPASAGRHGVPVLEQEDPEELAAALRVVLDG